MHAQRSAFLPGAATALLLILPAVPVQAGAERRALPTEQSFFDTLPTVLSASRLVQPLPETPATVTVIDRELIEASGARSVPELVRLAPGFQLSYVNGHTPVVNYHGLSGQYSRRMLVLVDDRAVYTPAFGGVPWSDLPLAIEEIERIEIIHGPNAVSYGANAFLGVISITTRTAAEEAGTHATLGSGSNGYRRALLRHAGSRGDLDYRFSAGYTRDNGLDSLEDGSRIHLLTGRADLRLGPDDRLRLQLGYNGGDREIPPATALQRTSARAVTSTFQQLRWERVLGREDELYLQLYHNHHRAEETARFDFDGQSLPFSLDISDERYDFEFQRSQHPLPGLRVAWGAGLRHDRVRSPAYFGTGKWLDSDLQRLFGSAEWSLGPGILLQGGLMVENDDLTGTHLSPRIALNARVAAGHTLRAAVSGAVRTPVLFEEALDYRIHIPPDLELPLGVSSGGLAPERILSREVGYVGEFRSLPLTVNLKLYHDRLEELVSYTSTLPLDYRNQDTATVTGTEAQITWRPDGDTRILLSYAYTDLDRSNVSGVPSYYRSAPLHTASLLALRRLTPRLSGSLAWYWHSPVPGDRFDAPYDDARQLDLRLAYGFGGRRRPGSLSLLARNLLDDSAETGGHKVFDTGWFLELNAAF
ncbi:TonB-dependent receptor plug domain-containing protein [Thioalbus denitrificans]|uniref:Iron complex outermembrane receptor protein n=1 Tax=Thioalbus denitrificans TaxID=547122 RepID=A0A369CGJ7_9GAMM|nr:TonB-dependent receptor plug domain-containing protein [Thioalbus denitrificans]RCX33192.1 iron complex outermembrane receptor protein [Thioalbus denitrificans]